MSIAILTSGGDSAGMNPAIKRFIEYCFQREETPYLVYDGLEGLIDGSIREAGWNDATGIIYRGGTVIRSTRSSRFYDPKFRYQAAEHLKSKRIDKLVMLGGDGSYKAMQFLQEETGLSIGCLPATIDNDVPGSDYSLGVDTALNVIREAIDGIRDTASSFSRAFVIETMGRNCGYLAMMSALVSGAEICLIPELPYSFEDIKVRLSRDINNGRRYVLAIVSEGVEHGAARVKHLLENGLSMTSRVTVLGHVQRGGSPTVHDRRMAAEFVTRAVDDLLNGNACFAVCSEDGTLTSKPLDTLPKVVALDPELLKLVDRLSH
jgi:6-phosphofructokinase 1